MDEDGFEVLGTKSSTLGTKVYFQPTTREKEWPEMWVSEQSKIGNLPKSLESMMTKHDLVQLGSLGNGSCYWISAALSRGPEVHPRDAIDLHIEAYNDNKGGLARWTDSSAASDNGQKNIRLRTEALKQVLDKVGGPLPRADPPKSPWGSVPNDTKALAVATNAKVHVYDVTKYEEQVAGVGERIKVQLFTPLLTDPLVMSYYVQGDGTNVYLQDQKSEPGSASKHIHLIYNGSDHFNAIVPQAQVNKQAA